MYCVRSYILYYVFSNNSTTYNFDTGNQIAPLIKFFWYFFNCLWRSYNLLQFGVITVNLKKGFFFKTNLVAFLGTYYTQLKFHLNTRTYSLSRNEKNKFRNWLWLFRITRLCAPSFILTIYASTFCLIFFLFVLAMFSNPCKRYETVYTRIRKKTLQNVFYNVYLLTH